MNTLEVLKKADEVKPVGEAYGRKIVTFDDAATLAQAEIINSNYQPQIDPPQLNPDGSVARTNKKFSAVNVETMLANRFRRIEEDGQTVVQVVTDHRAIMEQSRGVIYNKQIAVFNIVREGKKLSLKSVGTISDDEFVKEFTHTLKTDDASEVMGLIQKAEAKTTAEDIGI